MKIIKHGFVSPKEKYPRAYNGWPTVISLSDGTLLAAWSGERLKHICPFGKVLPHARQTAATPGASHTSSKIRLLMTATQVFAKSPPAEF